MCDLNAKKISISGKRSTREMQLTKEKVDLQIETCFRDLLIRL